jgi:hypothetical protein
LSGFRRILNPFCRFGFIRVNPLKSDLIRACALKRFGAQARSIAFVFYLFGSGFAGLGK